MRVPKLCRRKDGRLYVTDPADGRQVRIDDDAHYARWVAEFLGRPTAGPREAPARADVAELLASYLAHADAYYRKRGEPTSQVHLVELAARHVRAAWGDGKDASAVRGPHLQALQRRLVEQGYARSSINVIIGAVRRIWRWGVAQDAVSAEALARLESVPDLRSGRTAARETARVRPAPAADVAAVLAVIGPPCNAMIRLQLLGGARPGEICALRPVDLDRSGEPWVYLVPPDWDKMHHKRKPGDPGRRVWFGPEARAVLAPLLAAAEAAGEQDRPLFRRADGRQLDGDGYSMRVRRACIKAGVPVWRPNQLRHARATEVRGRFGPEAAQVFLGHENINTTEIYAETDEALARRVAEQSG